MLSFTMKTNEHQDLVYPDLLKENTRNCDLFFSVSTE